MKKGPIGERCAKQIKILTIALAVLIVVINFQRLNTWLGNLLSLLAPIIFGLVLAYLLNPFFRFFERKAFYRCRPMWLRRTVSLVCTYLAFLLIVALLVLLIIPQLYSSIANFITNYESYLNSAVTQYNRFAAWGSGVLASFGLHPDFLQQTTLESVTKRVTGILSSLDTYTKWIDASRLFDASTYLLSIFRRIVSGIFEIIFAFLISLYLLASKEKRYAQVMRLRRALFSDATNAKLSNFFSIVDRSFGGFLEGKIVDSLIIGLLTYVVVVVARIPYPVLMAAIVGITNVIPVIGPIIGAIPTSIIILFTEPSKVIPFLIIVFVIQQIDGNIIGPKILGDNTGVSSLCVLISITVMGNIWGLVGMLLGVPIFATVLELNEQAMEKRLRRKGLSSATESFYPEDSMVDPVSDVENNTDKILRRYQKKVLQLQKKLDEGTPLSRMERILFSSYGFGKKIHLFPEMTDEVFTAFAAEESVRAARKTARKELEQIKAGVSEPTDGSEV